MSSQLYEEYWKLTVEYTDINSDKFIGTLSIIVDFIERNRKIDFSSDLYKKLQEEVAAVYPKVDMGSVRKSINQFVKLGFIYPELIAYHENTLEFLEAKTNRKRQSVFSKIFYANSSFNSSITNASPSREINFLIKTLEENWKLHKSDIMALMSIEDISKVEKWFLDSHELHLITENAKRNWFWLRKYNQVGYLWDFLKKLDDLCIKDDYLYFLDDANVIFNEDTQTEKKGRDNYLHRIYKNQLKEEVEEKSWLVKCMVENLAYPVLIASHIKPYIKSEKIEAYDPDNGLLLSKNMDSLFDLWYISFTDDWEVIKSTKLSSDVLSYLDSYRLDEIFLNENRKNYLKYHREKVFVEQ